MAAKKYNVRDYFRHDIKHEDEAHLVLWEAWFAQHGIDASEVLLTEWVERRTYNENKIVYLVDAVRDGVPITRERVKILDQPPAPFPVP